MSLTIDPHMFFVAMRTIAVCVFRCLIETARIPVHGGAKQGDAIVEAEQRLLKRSALYQNEYRGGVGLEVSEASIRPSGLIEDGWRLSTTTFFLRGQCGALVNTLYNGTAGFVASAKIQQKLQFVAQNC